MNFRFLSLLLIIFMGGCASNKISKDNLMPRYVSPLLYLNYKCEQMRSVNSEFQQAEIFYNTSDNLRSDFIYNYVHKNAILYNETKLDQLGQSVLLGHRIALGRAANLSDCQL